LTAKAASVGAPSTAATLPPEAKTRTNSLDPGERAIASLVAVGSAPLARRLALLASNYALGGVADKDSVPWHNALQVRNAPTIAEARPGVAPSKLMGLFNVSARVRDVQDVADHKEVMRAASKIPEIQDVVDSFIDKHDLARKGVRMNFHGGILGGNYYNPSTKEVFFKDVGKEKVLHELGHAADFTSSRLGKLRGRFGPMLERGAYAALPIALIAGDRIKEMLPGTIDDKAISFMQDHAPAIMGATLAATQLYPEAKASALALQHIAKTEGPQAARAAFKRLGPAWATYLLGVIPPIVGMALARKYMRQARDEQAQQGDIEKVGSLMRDITHGAGAFLRDTAKDLGHVGKQISSQTADMIRSPGTGRRILEASKAVGTSPEFVNGALSAAVPATLGALYLYGTEAGKHIRERIHPSDRTKYMAGRHDFELVDTIPSTIPGASLVHERWREQHPMRFAGLVALGSALAGGIAMKMMFDLRKVL
jgi:hypothetical protein